MDVTVRGKLKLEQGSYTATVLHSSGGSVQIDYIVLVYNES